MWTIEQTGQFKRDYKRELKGSHRQTLASDCIAIITALANDLLWFSALPSSNPPVPHATLIALQSRCSDANLAI